VLPVSLWPTFFFPSLSLITCNCNVQKHSFFWNQNGITHYTKRRLKTLTVTLPYSKALYSKKFPFSYRPLLHTTKQNKPTFFSSSKFILCLNFYNPFSQDSPFFFHSS
jgi:hypothetical protein